MYRFKWILLFDQSIREAGKVGKGGGEQANGPGEGERSISQFKVFKESSSDSRLTGGKNPTNRLIWNDEFEKEFAHLYATEPFPDDVDDEERKERVLDMMYYDEVADLMPSDYPVRRPTSNYKEVSPGVYLYTCSVLLWAGVILPVTRAIPSPVHPLRLLRWLRLLRPKLGKTQIFPPIP